MNTKDAKIRVIAISNDEDTKENLDAAAKKKIEEWQKKFKDDISKQKDAKQIEFDEIAHQAKQPEEISLKLKTYAHSEFSNDEYSNEKIIKKKIEENIDLFNRGHKYVVKKIDKSFPKYLIENLEKFKEWFV